MHIVLLADCGIETSYKDAAEHYEQAWRHGQENNATIGYKLAWNYLKAKRFVDAMDVCHHIMQSPEANNFPKLRKDVMDKARNSVRL